MSKLTLTVNDLGPIDFGRSREFEILPSGTVVDIPVIDLTNGNASYEE